MYLEVWSVIAAVGTFVVITVTAIAALVQLSHLRNSNQLQALISMGQELREMAPLAGFVYHELPKKMESAEFRRDIGLVLNRDSHPELIVATFMEHLGAMIKHRLMDEALVLDFAGGADAILRGWNNLKGVIEIRRRSAPTPMRTSNTSHQGRGAGKSASRRELTRHPNRACRRLERNSVKA